MRVWAIYEGGQEAGRGDLRGARARRGRALGRGRAVEGRLEPRAGDVDAAATSEGRAGRAVEVTGVLGCNTRRGSGRVCGARGRAWRGRALGRGRAVEGRLEPRAGRVGAAATARAAARAEGRACSWAIVTSTVLCLQAAGSEACGGKVPEGQGGRASSDSNPSKRRGAASGGLG